MQLEITQNRRYNFLFRIYVRRSHMHTNTLGFEIQDKNERTILCNTTKKPRFPILKLKYLDKGRQIPYSYTKTRLRTSSYIRPTVRFPS